MFATASGIATSLTGSRTSRSRASGQKTRLAVYGPPRQTPRRQPAPPLRPTGLAHVRAPVTRVPQPPPSAGGDVNRSTGSSDVSSTQAGSGGVPIWAAVGSVIAVVADVMDGPGHIPLAAAVLGAAFLSLASSSPTAPSGSAAAASVSKAESSPLPSRPAAASSSTTIPLDSQPQPGRSSSSKSAVMATAASPSGGTDGSSEAPAPAPPSSVSSSNGQRSLATAAGSAESANASPTPAADLVSAAQAPLSCTLGGTLAASRGSGKGRVMTAGGPVCSKGAPPSPAPRLTPVLTLVGTVSTAAAAWMCYQGANIASAAPAGLCAAAVLLFAVAFGLQATKPKPPKFSWSA